MGNRRDAQQYISNSQSNWSWREMGLVHGMAARYIVRAPSLSLITLQLKAIRKPTTYYSSSSKISRKRTLD